MKRIIVLAFLLTTFIGMNYAQTKKHSQTFILTEKGVSALQLDKKFVTKPQAGSVYDAAVKIDRGLYQLKKGGKEIGNAVVSGGKLLGFTIYATNVELENGVKIGMPFTEAIQKEGVEAGFEIFASPGDEWVDMSIRCKNIKIEGASVSESGQKVIEKINARREAGTFDYDNPNFPQLTPEHINKSAKVESFHVGQEWVEGFTID